MEERRSSGRTDIDQKVMGKAVNRAKHKNLEIVVGITVLPIVLNSAQSNLHEIACKIYRSKDW